MHHTGSYFQLYDNKYVYNGKQNKVNTIKFCVRPWYCDTDNRLPCFVFRAFDPITLWINPDKNRTFNPSAAAAAAASAAAAAAAARGHADWLTAHCAIATGVSQTPNESVWTPLSPRATLLERCCSHSALNKCKIWQRTGRQIIRNKTHRILQHVACCPSPLLCHMMRCVLIATSLK